MTAVFSISKNEALTIAPLLTVVFLIIVICMDSITNKFIELNVDPREFSRSSASLIYVYSSTILILSVIVTLVQIFFGLIWIKDQIYEEAVKRVEQNIKNNIAIADKLKTENKIE